MKDELTKEWVCACGQRYQLFLKGTPWVEAVGDDSVNMKAQLARVTRQRDALLSTLQWLAEGANKSLAECEKLEKEAEHGTQTEEVG